MQIEDGKGNGRFASVNVEGRLATQAVNQGTKQHNSLIYSNSYHIYSGERSLTSGVEYGLIAIRNDGSLPLLVNHVTMSVNHEETNSVKWTLVSTFLPIVMGLIVTFLVAQIWRLLVQN